MVPLAISLMVQNGTISYFSTICYYYLLFFFLVKNPNASEASYEPKQLIYRKTKLKKTGGEKNRGEKNWRGKDLARKRPSGEKAGHPPFDPS